jgi:putative acetyltransferase
MKNNLEIRLETERDFREAEEMTREAFWNFYVPGCNEHLLVHNFRKHKDAIPELNFLAFLNDRIVGNIVYSRSKIVSENDTDTHTITFGPLSVHPEFQNQGIGGKLINHSFSEAKKLGYKAILIYGYPEYYTRFGFQSASKFSISRSDGEFAKALLAFEIDENSLSGITGKFFESSGFESTEEELIDFDKSFPPKLKEITESQKRFEEMVNAIE